MPELIFYFDVVCPYAYLASTKIEDLAKKYEIKLIWRPVLLGGIYKKLKAPQVPAKVWPVSKIKYGTMDLKRQAEISGVPLEKPASHPMRTVEAMRLLCACPENKITEMAHRLYQAYWVHGEDIRSPELLNKIAKKFGLPENSHLDGHAKKRLFENTDEACRFGAFGVPTIRIGDKIWWGQDRLHFVEKYLEGAAPKWPESKSNGPEIDFFHDFSSPFSYLASTQVESVAERYGSKLNWKPILLGALFREIGTANVPMFTMNRQKQAYVLRDLHEWADWWEVPFKFPKRFPLRSVLPLRISIAYPQLVHRLYRAYWVDGVDISDQSSLRDILIDEGMDPDQVLEDSQRTEIKQQLRINTEIAVKAEICGVPSFRVGQEIWWGQDRIFDLAGRLAKG